jgi:hypothetical protein
MITAGNTVILVVVQELAAKRLMLQGHRQVPLYPAPLSHPLEHAGKVETRWAPMRNLGDARTSSQFPGLARHTQVARYASEPLFGVGFRPKQLLEQHQSAQNYMFPQSNMQVKFQ